MPETRIGPTSAGPRGPRWWPAMLLLLAAIAAIVGVRLQTEWPFQKRNLTTVQIALIAGMLLLAWWTFFSRVAKRPRLTVTFSLLTVLVLGFGLFRIRGVSGDLLPILEFRWARHSRVEVAPVTATNFGATIPMLAESDRSAFPQFLGPNRDGVLRGPLLDTNWVAHPPEIVWRQKVGAAWSGFAVVGGMCLTQEQRGDAECVVAYELSTGRQLWVQTEPVRYATTIAGEGPRTVPTVVSNRVFTLGATGILNCLDLATGRRLWTRNLLAEFGGKLPEWGFASSPLVVDERVIVHGGEAARHSLHAFHVADGAHLWSGGTTGPSYASPTLATLAGVRQVLAFNDGAVSGHDPATGAVLWLRPWGNGNVVCSAPVVVSSNQVLFSSGYGCGSELFELSRGTNTTQLSVQRQWKSIRMKSKFGHLFIQDGCLFGLDDGIMTCVDLRDGSLRWKEGRYGHGQGLLVAGLYLLMAESGELVLLRPTPDRPDELARFRVFGAKTWNPPALSDDLLLVRNDQEAVCLRLPVLRYHRLPSRAVRGDPGRATRESDSPARRRH